VRHSPAEALDPDRGMEFDEHADLADGGWIAGKDADLVVLDSRLAVRNVYVGGVRVQSKPSTSGA